MPFEMIRNDITTMNVDAIVNSANPSLLGGGGLDGAIHRAAGPKLMEACRKLNGCRTGEAKITRGFSLPARYVIHTVGPVWHGGDQGEEEKLASCYRSSLDLALKKHCESIAFPLISANTYGYPKDQALTVAVDVISHFLMEHDMMIYLVLFGSTEFLTGKKLFRDVLEYVDDTYVVQHVNRKQEQTRKQLWQANEEKALQLDMEIGAGIPEAMEDYLSASGPAETDLFADAATQLSDPDSHLPVRPKGAPRPPRRREGGKEQGIYPDSVPHSFPGSPVSRPARPSRPPDWDALLSKTDEGFSETLLRLIDEKGLTDTECYKRANFDRKMFSKIRSNPSYRPTKPTVFAFAIALRLNLEETRDLLNRAGFALSRSSRFDIIMEYFIVNGIYDIYEINEVLFQFDMPLLGSSIRA